MSSRRARRGKVSTQESAALQYDLHMPTCSHCGTVMVPCDARDLPRHESQRGAIRIAAFQCPRCATFCVTPVSGGGYSASTVTSRDAGSQQAQLED